MEGYMVRRWYLDTYKWLMLTWLMSRIKYFYKTFTCVWTLRTINMPYELIQSINRADLSSGLHFFVWYVRLLRAYLTVSWYDLSLYSITLVSEGRCHRSGFLFLRSFINCSGLYSGLNTDNDRVLFFFFFFVRLSTL